jgi:hypothetical protein
MSSKKKKPSSKQKKTGESGRKLIRFDFLPDATPEEIAEGIDKMREKYQRDK